MRWSCECASRRWRWVARSTGPAWRSAGAAERGAGPRSALWARAQRDLDVLAVVVADDLQRHRLARRELDQDRVERVLAVDRLAVDAHDDVAGLEPRLARRAVVDDCV